MKRTTTNAKSKKVTQVQGQQKISSFFNKLTVHRSSKITKEDVIPSSSSLNKNNCLQTCDIEIKATRHKNAKNETPKKNKIVSIIVQEEESSESNFTPTRKEKEIVKKLAGLNSNDENNCSIILATVKEISQKYSVQSEKSKQSSISSEVSNNSSTRLDIAKQSRKRKFECDSPDIIPPTPQEIIQKFVRPKSKLNIENKLSKLENKEISTFTCQNKIKLDVSLKRISNDENDFSVLTDCLNDKTISPIKISPKKSPSPLKESLTNTILKDLNGEDSSVLNGTILKIDNSKNSLKCNILKKSNLINSFKSDGNINFSENIQEIETTEIYKDIFADDWEEEVFNIDNNLNTLNLDTWQYCTILEISKDSYFNLILKLQSIEYKQETVCILRGVWQYSTFLKQGDIINIMAIKQSGEIPYFIDNNAGVLIYEPDFLISPTSIVGAHFCKRKGILTEKFRGFESTNKIMIIGTLVHRLTQNILQNQIYKPYFIEKELNKILSSKETMTESYFSQVPIEELKKELNAFVPKINNFIKKYIRNNKVKQLTQKIDSEDWQGTIHKIHDIEENIWCPQLGLKGKVDITIQTSKEEILPLEIKTGRASMSLEHKGQVIIYLLMMSELGYEIKSGLLLYLREDTLREISASHREKRDLIMLRNEFAYFMKQKPTIINKINSEVHENKILLSELDPKKQMIFGELPEPINHHSACEKCPYATVCTTILSRDDNIKLDKTHPLQKLTKQLLNHLKPQHIDYFLHWISLINLENDYKSSVKELKDIWRFSPVQREKHGKAICYLKICERVREDNNSFLHTFERQKDEKTKNVIRKNNLKNDFILSGLSTDNYVIISTEIRTAIATGFIVNITSSSITVSLERDLTERYSEKVFHLDTYESQQILSFNMTSLAELLEPTERANQLRELIIDRKSSIITELLSKKILTTTKDILLKLNIVQQRAVLKSLTVQDYFLIKGMPGTGKTATLIALIQLLVNLNKSVLITSHTHSAVDNVCLKLLKCGVNMLRLGSESRIHPQVKHRSENALTAHCKTVEELQEVYTNATVVAVTCLGARHPIFNEKTFDVCIIDESTQVLQCTILKVLLSAKSFILIGDPDQLPPVVKNHEAMQRGMNESLFERLDNLGATITLNLQYRMNKVITDLANALTYNGDLICANEQVSCATLNLPELQVFRDTYKNDEWLLNILDNKLDSSVIAVNTGPTWNLSYTNPKDSLSNLLDNLQVPCENVQEDEERKCSNNYEASIIVFLVDALKKAGISLNSIGIIAPYRAQVALLKNLFIKLNENELCEINTVDQYQGRDKDVIIYSCTKSRDISKPKTINVEILDDKRRLNVAITRAKYKLIIIGDFQTLKEYLIFDKLLRSLNDKQKYTLKDQVDGFCWTRVLNV